ncbi:MAG: TetR family transcriptional regulator [Ornithinimicrobium sp.]
MQSTRKQGLRGTVRRTKADSDATAASLLIEATRQFAERGYAAVSIEDIAVGAGVTRGAVAHHFGTKRHLFERVLARTQEAVGDQVADAADLIEDPWLAFEAGCRAFLEQCLAPSVRRIVMIDGPAVLGWDTWRGHDAATSGRHLADALDGLVDQGIVDIESVPATTALLSGAMNEAALWVASQPEESALTEAWSDLRRLLVAMRTSPRDHGPDQT